MSEHSGSARSRDHSQTKSSSPRERSKSKDESRSRLSTNKIYRTPPSPKPDDLFRRERTFTLDCIAVSNISNDYSRANPKLGKVAPPYNAQRDHHCGSYFGFVGVDKTLKNTNQEKGGCSIDGPVYERFFKQGAGFRYLTYRNMSGAGHSKDQISGHGQFMQGVKPVMGYNGQYGYRRNTPLLRQRPSEFGVATWTPIY